MPTTHSGWPWRRVIVWFALVTALGETALLLGLQAHQAAGWKGCH